MRLGLLSVLADAECRVLVDDAPEEQLQHLLHAGSVDVVLLDLDTPAWVDAAPRIAAQHRVVVIACSAERPLMRVFDASPLASERELTAAALAGAVAEATAPART
jgi:hypothetical protein